MRISTIGYSMKQGVKNIRRNKMFSVASIATMAACIFLFGLFYSIVVNFSYIVEKAEEGGYLTIFKTTTYDFCCFEPDGCLDDHIIVLTKTHRDPLFGECRYAYGLIATEDDMPKIIELATSSD